MNDVTSTEQTAAELRLAQQYRRNGGWMTAGYFNGAPEDVPRRDAMLADGRLVADQMDRIAVYRLTDAGKAWLAAQEA